MNALWNNNYGSNIRILLLNNGGGEIFNALPGLELHQNASRFVVANHQASGRAWAEDRGFEYLSAHNEAELNSAVARFIEANITDRPMLLEVFTEKAHDVELLKEYFRSLKKK